VSEDAITWALPRLVAEYPGLEVHGIVADFERHLERLPQGGPRLVAFLGGTIGNFEPAQRAAFLSALGGTLEPGDALLLGTDLVKDPERLVRAYDDSAGVTAEFNLNVLRVIDRELGADFDVDAFEHVAVWDADQEWIEMRLRSRVDQRVDVPALDLTVDFAAGEEMRTEVSAKFRERKVAAELAAAGLRLAHWWTDRPGDFALSLSFV
jgi:L-histidine Nalpha-methyltransferase